MFVIAGCLYICEVEISSPWDSLPRNNIEIALFISYEDIFSRHVLDGFYMLIVYLECSIIL
jgi:hypothetical protein